MAPWPEVLTAKNENKREIILNGAKINERIKEKGFDAAIYELTALNYLNIHDSILNEVQDEIGNLQNLQTLVLHSNKLEKLNVQIFSLAKLKVLDLSRNLIGKVPEEISKLTHLDTLNLSMNQIEELPDLSKNTKLAVVNASKNKLKEFDIICKQELNCLSDLNLSNNEIEVLPHSISQLVSLKNFYLEVNKITVLPGELVDCNKLKDVRLKQNPVSDRRLLKLIDQCHTKQILDYVKQHCTRSTVIAVSNTKKDAKKNNLHTDTKQVAEMDDARYKIHVKHCVDDGLRILVKEDVKSIRGHILACLVHNVQFTEESFKKFIKLQTKLHETICEKRNSATIATHDAKKLHGKSIIYTACPPTSLMIKPLMGWSAISGAELYAKLQSEADALRKEKKRNVYSGIHKYLYLLEGKKMYPCLMADEEVISFPPITNSDVTKISIETTSMFLEVTSATSQFICKKVMDTLIKEMVTFFDTDLFLEQVKNVDVEGNMKAIYPSRVDLVFEDSDSIEVIRN
ncbi:hypothetical protein AMK59_3514 [Oryctes borbonicus]|uniref:B3/B4 tRNA-binding domain-containing protein n=1 Tax=Oryctes borbonicus TaxID=1629725 RepID=A0A0T6B631_9SCAR|nr:hypothetical protein AMK59_3514 [Oryctes borbonicus]